MRIEYCDHALDQIKDRGISKQEVEQCILNHDIEYADKCGNPIYIGKVQGRRIKVVIMKESEGKDTVWVITAAEKNDDF